MEDSRKGAATGSRGEQMGAYWSSLEQRGADGRILELLLEAGSSREQMNPIIPFNRLATAFALGRLLA